MDYRQEAEYWEQQCLKEEEKAKKFYEEEADSYGDYHLSASHFFKKVVNRYRQLAEENGQ